MKFDIKSIIDGFRYDPNSVKRNYDGRTDIYLAKVSYRYAYIKRVLILILVLVLIAFILSGNLSYSKLYYLTKDIKLAGDFVNSVHDTITYNVGNSQSFVAYRSGIAVASREGLSIFSAGGRELFSTNHSYGNPNLLANNKYVLLFDVGGNQFSLYNSFSKVREGILDYPIYGGCISQGGNFALISKSEKYDSVVKVYQSNGTEYTYNFSSGRVCSASFSPNGLQIAICVIYPDTDGLRSEIRTYRVGSGDYNRADVTFAGVPYEMRVLDNGSIAVLGARGVNVFSSGLNLLGEYLSDKEIYAYDFGNDNVVIAHASEDGSETEVVLLNKRCKVEKRIELEERILDVVLYKGYLFTQSIGGFERTNTVINQTKRIDIVATDFKMISVDKNTLIICNDSYAKFLEFGQ